MIQFHTMYMYNYILPKTSNVTTSIKYKIGTPLIIVCSQTCKRHTKIPIETTRQHCYDWYIITKQMGENAFKLNLLCHLGLLHTFGVEPFGSHSYLYWTRKISRMEGHIDVRLKLWGWQKVPQILKMMKGWLLN